MSLFLDALKSKNHGRPPIWVMRQAGRYMPEYRNIREKYTFLDMVRTPEIAAEVTLLPINVFGMDAAIIFSDILVVTEALGFPVHFEENKGPVFEHPIMSAEEINRREPPDYTAQAIGLAKPQLKVPLIGFCGGPFTVASYMIEGCSSRDFKKTKQWMMRNPESFHKILHEITLCTIEYLKLLIAAGADAIQIFDSWTHLLGEIHFQSFATTYHKMIIEAIGNIPTILFCRGTHHLASTFPHALSLDWSCSLPQARKMTSLALQGNMDPHVLYGSHQSIRNEVNRILDSMKNDPGYIFNLGHGILPDIPVDAVKTLVEAVQCR